MRSYNCAMPRDNPKSIRRRILLDLYEVYQEQPLQMVSAEELIERTGISREVLPPNAFYLHDRGLVEMMVGYTPPLFAGIRISPRGIDLVEDRAKFDIEFPELGVAESETRAVLMPLLMRVVDEIEASAMNGARRAWLLQDVARLRDELRQPRDAWRSEHIKSLFEGFDDYFDGAAAEYIRAISHLQKILADEFDLLND